MKKVFSFLSILCFIAVLSSCGGSANNNANNAKFNTYQGEDNAEPGEEYSNEDEYYEEDGNSCDNGGNDAASLVARAFELTLSDEEDYDYAKDIAAMEQQIALFKQARDLDPDAANEAIKQDNYYSMDPNNAPTIDKLIETYEKNLECTRQEYNCKQNGGNTSNNGGTVSNNGFN